MPQHFHEQREEKPTISAAISERQAVETSPLRSGEFLLVGEWGVQIKNEKNSPEVQFLRDNGFMQALGRINLPNYEGYDRRLTINDVKRVARQLLADIKAEGKEPKFTIENLDQTIERVFATIKDSDTHK